jgi:hypothetical protein
MRGRNICSHKLAPTAGKNVPLSLLTTHSSNACSPPRFSLAEFRAQACIHQTALKDAEDQIAKAYALFDPREIVSRDQVLTALAYLRDGQKACRIFYAFLKDSNKLPLAVVPIRFQLIAALKKMDIQLLRAICLVKEMRTICGDISHQAARLQLDIQIILDTLHIAIGDVLREEVLLLDRMYFHDRMYGTNHSAKGE